MEQSRACALIRTRPLGQGNYGGILQAYALQQALRLLGVNAITDLSPGVPVGSQGHSVSGPKSFIKRALTRFGPPGIARNTWIAEEIRGRQDQSLTRFVSERIDTIRLYDDEGRIDDKVLDEVDLFITGSDQVWRAAFGRVPTYLFDFVAADDPRPKIAYAASFGTDDEYTPEMLNQTRGLARRLSAISVRESSGIELVRRFWGLDAVHVLDPTLLLEATRYSSLADATVESNHVPGLVSYVLDRTLPTQRTVASVGVHLGLGLRPLMPPIPPTYRAYYQDPGRYARASIECWLATIRDAEFVVTDSFHGTVFAILFNRPFISVVNRDRGAARFESLLRMFGLERRLVEPGWEPSREFFASSIDWGRVNSLIDINRELSFDYLRKALSSLTLE